MCNILYHFSTLTEHCRRKQISSVRWCKLNKSSFLQNKTKLTLSNFFHCESFSVFSLKFLAVQARPTTFIQGKLFLKALGAAYMGQLGFSGCPVCFIRFVLVLYETSLFICSLTGNWTSVTEFNFQYTERGEPFFWLYVLIRCGVWTEISHYFHLLEKARTKCINKVCFMYAINNNYFKLLIIISSPLLNGMKNIFFKSVIHLCKQKNTENILKEIMFLEMKI